MAPPPPCSRQFSFENGEFSEAEPGGAPPPGPVRRAEGRDPKELRQGYARQAVRALFGCRDSQIPEQGDPEGLRQEDGQEVPGQGLHQARQPPARDAHALQPGRRPQGGGDRRLAADAGQEGGGGEGSKGPVGGAVQKRQEPVVLYQV